MRGGGGRWCVDERRQDGVASFASDGRPGPSDSHLKAWRKHGPPSQAIPRYVLRIRVEDRDMNISRVDGSQAVAGAIVVLVVLGVGWTVCVLPLHRGQGPGSAHPFRTTTPTTVSYGGHGGHGDRGGVDGIRQPPGRRPPPHASADGTWKVATGSTAGYRVKETLLGQSNTAGWTDDRAHRARSRSQEWTWQLAHSAPISRRSRVISRCGTRSSRAGSWTRRSTRRRHSSLTKPIGLGTLAGRWCDDHGFGYGPVICTIHVAASSP